MVKMRSYGPSSATRKPCTSARPRPCFASRCETRTRASRDASASARAPVPSGELSSTTSTCASGRAARIPATIASKFSRSLYVGRRTTSAARWTSALREEAAHAVGDGLQLRVAELGVHREGEHLGRKPLRHRQGTAPAPELRGGLLQVARDRVVHAGADAARPEMFAQRVALRRTDDIEVEDVLLAARQRRPLDRQIAEELVVPARDLAAPRVPDAKAPQLDAQHGRLQLVRPRVVAHEHALVARSLPVVAQ